MQVTVDSSVLTAVPSSSSSTTTASSSVTREDLIREYGEPPFHTTIGFAQDVPYPTGSAVVASLRRTPRETMWRARTWFVRAHDGTYSVAWIRSNERAPFPDVTTSFSTSTVSQLSNVGSDLNATYLSIGTAFDDVVASVRDARDRVELSTVDAVCLDVTPRFKIGGGTGDSEWRNTMGCRFITNASDQDKKTLVVWIAMMRRRSRCVGPYRTFLDAVLRSTDDIWEQFMQTDPCSEGNFWHQDVRTLDGVVCTQPGCFDVGTKLFFVRVPHTSDGEPLDVDVRRPSFYLFCDVHGGTRGNTSFGEDCNANLKHVWTRGEPEIRPWADDADA